MAEQRETKGKNAWYKAVIIITVLGITAIVALVTTAVLQNKPLLQKYKYGIVLDAGSSHTAVYIYEWPAEKDNDTGRVQQTHSCKVQGAGISSYSVFPGQAGASLKSCMKEAESLIPLSRHHETPLYLGATAGMRLLRMENQSLSDQVLWSVEEVLRSSPFSYQGARIITGQEEGAFGWVTVNYLSDRLKQGSGTTGALDLGGASTQISFVANQDVAEESAENAVTFRLYGNDYFLYTHSFLCYGKDQALKLALAQQTQSGDSSVLDPCFHPGYSVDRSYFSVYSSPCVMAGKPLVSRDSFTHAFSAFYFVMNFLNLTSGSLESSREKLERYCSRPWTQIKQQHPDVKEKYLAEYCFSGSYILSLLTDGYNFTSDTWTDITFIKKISGSDAGWSLGYMLNLTNMIPAEAPDTPPLPHAGYVTLLFFISLLLFFLLFLCFRFLWPRRNSQTQMI